MMGLAFDFFMVHFIEDMFVGNEVRFIKHIKYSYFLLFSPTTSHISFNPVKVTLSTVNFQVWTFLIFVTLARYVDKFSLIKDTCC